MKKGNRAAIKRFVCINLGCRKNLLNLTCDVKRPRCYNRLTFTHYIIKKIINSIPTIPLRDSRIYYQKYSVNYYFILIIMVTSKHIQNENRFLNVSTIISFI